MCFGGKNHSAQKQTSQKNQVQNRTVLHQADMGDGNELILSKPKNQQYATHAANAHDTEEKGLKVDSEKLIKILACQMNTQP